MPALKHTLGQMDGGQTRRTFGTAYFDGTTWFANVGGSLLTARWVDPFQAVQGAPIVVDITTDERGQSSAFVVGGYTDQPRPSTGTILTLTPDTVIAGSFGGSVVAERLIGTYALGDSVYLQWDSDRPTVIGKVPAVTVAPVAAPPPPPVVVVGTGTTTLRATATDTFGVGGWGRWATSQRGGEDVYTGSMGGYTVTGSWFYGAPKTELTGVKATRIRFKVPARLNVGASGATTINVYAHTNQARPGGDVNRTGSPVTLSIPANFPGGYYDLPTTFAPVLAAGGGISIAGGPYAGFQGRLDDPEAGKLIIDWTR